MALLTCSASTMQIRLLYDVIGYEAYEGRLDQLFANRRDSR
jgi:hypothetical protein